MEGSGLRCGPNSEDRGAYHESVHEYDSRHLRSSKGSFRPSDVGLDGDGGVPVSVLMLTGARGSGKSCVGAALAAQQDRPFVDLDAAALALTGLDSVAEVFEQAGEHAWRQAEAAALKESLRIPEVIIATGGGVPCIDPGRSQLLRARSEGTPIVVWLRCSPEVLAARLEKDLGDRPSLTGGDPIKESVQVASGREAMYASTADHVVDASGPVADVAQAIADVIS